jgi:CubicO group peptidase (beta-lactamase class C family)
MLAWVLVPTSGSAQGGVQVTAAQVQKAIEELDKLAQKELENNVVPGLAIAVVFQDKMVYAKGFGVREVGKPETVDENTVFQLASVSKPLGATVVAALVGEGKITWDSKLSQLDPTFELYDPWVTREITIRDTYAHRSGLPEHSGDLLEDLGYDRAQVLYRLRFYRPASSFRSHYAYTNFVMTEGGVAAASAYGLTWEDASEQKLYKPLGMDATSSRYSDFVARTNKALGHVLVAGKWVHKFQREPDAQSPAGGASSSAHDMAKWLRLQLAHGTFDGKQIVAENALAETHHPHILRGFSPLDGLPNFYGLGMNVSYDQQGRLRLNHSGAFALGAATHVHMVPSEQLGIVVLTNAYPIGVAEGLGQTFIETALYGTPTRDWLALFKQLFANPSTVGVVVGTDYSKPPTSPTPALRNDAYLGTYTNDYFGAIIVIEKDGALAIVEGPRGMTFALKHYDRDIFTYETGGENAAGMTGVIFTLGADGKASTVLVENLNVRGEGTFTRSPDKSQ